ncbi:Hypothetical protein BN2458_PEG0269 [Helicobacter typhlonius]|uniref:Uncharacterized protein n=1 Tax=Helicobacter typhlonius TaxID=76936 RepID=A0A0S4PUN0_9HELI|nr:Hypothetical protein BN2458_PEG0269 [Helicobacter typhlonius]
MPFVAIVSHEGLRFLESKLFFYKHFQSLFLIAFLLQRFLLKQSIKSDTKLACSLVALESPPCKVFKTFVVSTSPYSLLLSCK